MDDFLLFDQSKAKLAEMRCAVADFLEGLRLRLFPEKSRLVRENVVRFRRRLRHLERAFREGAATREQIRTRIHSWIGHAAAGNTWRLREQLFAQFTLANGSAV